MIVEFVRKIALKQGLTSYSLAKKLGVTTTTAQKWLGEHGYESPKGLQLGSLCKLRELGGLSWEDLGKMLDKEFLKK